MTICRQSTSTMLVNTSELSWAYLMWQKCLASLLLGSALDLLLPLSYQPTHQPLKFFRLYTHGFLIASIVSAILGAQVTSEIKRYRRWSQSGVIHTRWKAMPVAYASCTTSYEHGHREGNRIKSPLRLRLNSEITHIRPVPIRFDRSALRKHSHKSDIKVLPQSGLKIGAFQSIILRIIAQRVI